MSNKTKNAFDGLTSTLDVLKEVISKLEDVFMESSQREKQSKKME